MFNKSLIKQILVISLTNIGDIILTFPVIDILKQELPDAQISVVIGPKGESLLKGNPCLNNVYIFDKKQSLPQLLRWILKLRKERFDLVIDLRNSAIPFLIGARYTTTPFLKRIPGQHMRYQHLRRLKSIYLYEKESEEKYALHMSEQDQRDVERMTREEISGNNQRYVVIAPGAADRGKRWSSEGFAQVCDHLIEKYHAKTVFVGDVKDRKKIQEVIKKMHNHGINLSGRANLTQLACLLQQSALLITNDSAPMHMASYLDVPVIGLFGPTDPKKYGPWGKHPYFIKKSNGRSSTPEECMRAIKAEDVIEKVEEIFNGPQSTVHSPN